MLAAGILDWLGWNDPTVDHATVIWSLVIIVGAIVVAAVKFFG